MLSVTLIIIIITCIVSIPAFNTPKIINDLIFYPPAIEGQKQWYRFFTCGLIHADVMHLAFNMYALYSFGRNVESDFTGKFDDVQGKFLYGLMYVTAIGFSLLPTYSKHKNDRYYRSLGASGAVSAVIFAGILLNPMDPIGLIFIPGRGIPGFIFGGIYLIASHFLAKKGAGNINHSAHLWGALFGMLFIFFACLAFTNYKPLQEFINQIRMQYGL